MSDRAALAGRLPDFRHYLLMLARARLGGAALLQGKLDPSDVVQQTLLEAHRDWLEFRGTSSGELAVWLRQILVRNLLNAERDLTRQKRDVRLEQSLEQQLLQSSVQLVAALADDAPSPVDLLDRDEQMLRLGLALSRLPDAQRQAVELRHLHGWTLDAIAAHLDRSPAAVAGLLHRGLKELRRLLSSNKE